jgi:hypothetical protein
MKPDRLVKAEDINQSDIINQYTTPRKAQANARMHYGEGAQLYRSTRKGKKFMILDPNTNKFVHFGAFGYQDATKHNDEERQDRYFKRAMGIKGNWRYDDYSPNNLSINILWQL